MRLFPIVALFVLLSCTVAFGQGQPNASQVNALLNQLLENFSVKEGGVAGVFKADNVRLGASRLGDEWSKLILGVTYDVVALKTIPAILGELQRHPFERQVLYGKALMEFFGTDTWEVGDRQEVKETLVFTKTDKGWAFIRRIIHEKAGSQSGSNQGSGSHAGPGSRSPYETHSL